MKIQTEKPFLEIDGVRYTVGVECAQIADVLQHNMNRTVPYERLAGTKGTAQVYVHYLRTILKPYGYEIRNVFKQGYMMTEHK